MDWLPHYFVNGGCYMANKFFNIDNCEVLKVVYSSGGRNILQCKIPVPDSKAYAFFSVYVNGNIDFLKEQSLCKLENCFLYSSRKDNKFYTGLKAGVIKPYAE